MEEADDMSRLKQGKRRVPNTDNTDRQQKPWLFKPGQSGNPAGRPKGSRNKLAENFLDDAYQQWRLHGSKALETMATSEPAKFCQMIAGLLPKEMHIQDASLNIREIRHVIVEAIKVGDKAIEHDETPAIGPGPARAVSAPWPGE
jgi:Family of unknown function (DUF5681)